MLGLINTLVNYVENLFFIFYTLFFISKQRYAEKWSPEKWSPEKWSPRKMVPRKNGPRKNGLQKLFSVKTMLGNLNDFHFYQLIPLHTIFPGTIFPRTIFPGFKTTDKRDSSKSICLNNQMSAIFFPLSLFSST